jgi:hypothetical protein
MDLFYILNDKGEIVPTSDPIEFAKSFECAETQSMKDEVYGVLVSTVFLGINHQYDPNGPPLVWETMVFGLKGQEDRPIRYSSKAEAEEGHKRMVELVKKCKEHEHETRRWLDKEKGI